MSSSLKSPAGSISTTGGDVQLVAVQSGESDDTVDFGYAVPAIREEFGLSLETIGWIFGLSFAVAGAAILIWILKALGIFK